jgi:NhaP-type Na+/H+ or K+/H+ antiporter
MIVGPIVKLIFKGYERTLAGLVSAILSVVDTKLAGQTSVVKIRERIGILLAALNDAITRVLKGQYTEALAIDDRNRDTLYRAFIYRL